MKINYNLIISILLSAFFIQVYASDNHLLFYSVEKAFPDTITQQKSDSTNSKLDKTNKTIEKLIRIYPIPAVSYSSETNWLFGLTKINSFRMGTKNQHDESIQPSRIMAVVYLTLNKQYKAFITSDLIFGKNKYESFTKVMFVDFPNYYYGVGDDTKLEDECWVETESLSFEQSFGYKFNKNWYVGIKYHYNNYYKVDSVPNAEVCSFDFAELEKNKGLQSGFGFKISRETRDNRLNAKKGSLLFFEFMNYGKWLGSKFEYNSVVFDFRKFITPKKWLTIAGQFYAEAKFGNVPVQSLALMGGDNRMRGIYIGRFRDKTMIEGQVEFRIPIYWIFSGTIFSGLGEVASDLGTYTWQGIKLTYGAGLRVSVNQATRSNVRFDVGFFEGAPLFFFNFTEAF